MCPAPRLCPCHVGPPCVPSDQLSVCICVRVTESISPSIDLFNHPSNSGTFSCQAFGVHALRSTKYVRICVCVSVSIYLSIDLFIFLCKCFRYLLVSGIGCTRPRVIILIHFLPLPCSQNPFISPVHLLNVSFPCRIPRCDSNTGC